MAVVSDSVPGRNGVGTYYDDLGEHLRPRIGVLRLICPPGESREGARGWRLPMPGDATQTLFVPRPEWVREQLCSAAPDVVIAPTPGLFGLLGMVLAGRMDAAFCVAYHTEFPELAEMYWRDRIGLGRVARWLGRSLDSFMFRHASAVLVHNTRLQRSVRRRGVENAELMETPAPPSFLSEPLRPLPDRMRSVTFVGRLAPEKELGQVMEVARALPELDLRIVGDGPLRADVETCASENDNVEAFGWVSRRRVREILDETDLLVLPSRNETFGSAAFEAMTRRRPALVSPHCGITEWKALTPGLFVMEEDERLVEAVARLRRADPRTRLRTAEKGRAAAVELTRRAVDHWVEVLSRAAYTGARR